MANETQKANIKRALERNLDVTLHVANYIKAANESSSRLKPVETSWGEYLLDQDKSDQVDTAIAATALLAKMEFVIDSPTVESDSWIPTPWNRGESILALIGALLARRLPFTDLHMEILLDLLGNNLSTLLCDKCFLKPIKDFIERKGLSDSLRQQLSKWRSSIDEYPKSYSKTLSPVKNELLILLQVDGEESDEQISQPLLEPTGEIWTDELEQHLAQAKQKERANWRKLLSHCAQAKTSKASKKWSAAASVFVKEIGSTKFKSLLVKILPCIGKPGEPERIYYTADYFEEKNATQVHQEHADLLRGLCWLAADFKDEKLVAALGDAAEICFHKIPGVGPRAPKIGLACLTALVGNKHPKAISQISRLKPKAKNKSVINLIDRALAKVADQKGVTVEEVEELSIPDFGLTGIGELRQTIGTFDAVFSIVSSTKTELAWIKPDGKQQKSVPATVKTKHAAKLKKLKKTVKEIGQQLPAHRNRIERFFHQKRVLEFADFEKLYLNHPLIGFLARRLIWKFTKGKKAAIAIWSNDKFVDQESKTVKWMDCDTKVELWHPIKSTAAFTLKWRDQLEENGVVQPFKQAHREVYLLTAAEKKTKTYSNRFAAHILKQHQFHALGQSRGWRYQLQGRFDGGGPAKIECSGFGISAEFDVEPASMSDHDRENVSPAGIFNGIATGRVRFFQLEDDSGKPISLTKVSKLAFSEIMRDVDLFVGVASVGNDPFWNDGGNRHQDYWTQFSFGTLSDSGKARSATLKRLVPRLKIANQCKFQGKFLIVKGSIRTYKIHMGSGNILMMPNDQYLCIVTSYRNRNSENVFLPFEGDARLSVILSKAMLLADDAKIKDETILSQINSK